MSKLSKELERQVAVLKAANASGKLRFAVEPLQLAFPQRVDIKSDKELTAVYGPAELIDQLETAGCLIRPGQRVDTAEESKAYVRADVAQHYFNVKTVDRDHPFTLFGLSRDPHDPTIAFYHTNELAIDPKHPGDSGDTMSYLLLRARGKKGFEHAQRLYDEYAPNMITSSRFMSQEQFMILPVRRSVADAIAASHPEAIALESKKKINQLKHGPNKMHAIVAIAQEDEHFKKQAPVKDIRPKTPEALPNPKIEARPIEYYLDALTPHVSSFQRTEFFSGSFASVVFLDDSAEVRRLVREIADSRYCKKDSSLSITYDESEAQSASGAKRYTITKGMFEKLSAHPQTGNVPTELKTQALNSDWSKPQPVSDPQSLKGLTRREIRELRTRPVLESISELRIANVRVDTKTGTGAATAVEPWLIVTAPSLKRAQMLAKQMNAQDEHVEKMTDEQEKPALIRIRLSPTMAQAILAANKNFNVEATPYNSPDALNDGQRTRANVQVIQQVQKKSEAAGESTPPTITRSASVDARDAAAEILFNDKLKIGLQRIWLDRVEKAKSLPRPGKPLPADAMTTIGIRVANYHATKFETALKNTKFETSTTHRLRFLGSTGSERNGYRIYRLDLRAADVTAWQAQRANDDAALGNDKIAPLVGGVGVLDEAITAHFEMPEVTSDPVDTAWQKLANDAQSGKMQCMEVRRDAAMVRAMESDLTNYVDIFSGTGAHGRSLKGALNSFTDAKIKFLDPDLDSLTHQIERDGLSIVGAALSFGRKVNRMPAAQKKHAQWLKEQPRQPDGSVVTSYLVIPNPASTTEFHFRQLADARYLTPEQVASNTKKLEAYAAEIAGLTPEQITRARKTPPILEKGTLILPQKPIVYNDILGKGRQVMLVPVNPDFFRALNEKGGQVSVLHDAPIDLASTPDFLRDTFREAPTEVIEEVRPSNVETLQAGARNRLLERGFEKCRGKILYASLGEQHSFDNLARDRERIGAQHALVLNFNHYSDWSQHIKPLIEDLGRAKMLQKRRYYGGEMELPLPEPLQQAEAKLAQLTTLTELLDSDFIYHLKALSSNVRNDYSWFVVGEKIKEMQNVLAQPDVPRELQSRLMRADMALKMVVNQRAAATDEDFARLLGIISETKETAAKDKAELQMSLDGMYRRRDLEPGVAQRSVEIKQDDEVLFFLPEMEKGVTQEALEKLLDANFKRGGGDKQMQAVVYLSPVRGANHAPDVEVIDKLKSLLPNQNATVRSVPASPAANAADDAAEGADGQKVQGEFTARVARPRYVRPPTQTPKCGSLDELFALLPNYFPAIASFRQ